MMDYLVDVIKTENFEMPYLKFGKGSKILVVLPGVSFRPVSSSPAGFLKRFADFEENYSVYLFDRKQQMEDGYSVEMMANDTLEAIKLLNLKDIYIYGASQGGMIGQLIAIKYPKLVKKLILASTSYYVNYSSLEFFEEITNLCKEYNARSLVSYCLRKMYSNDFISKYKDGLVELFSNLSKEEIDQFLFECKASEKIYTLNDLNKITAKTLIVCSKEDLIFGYEVSLQMALKLNCECVLYDDYSHCVYDEAEDFISRIKTFLDTK